MSIFLIFYFDLFSGPTEGECQVVLENQGEDKIDIVFFTEGLDKSYVQDYVDYFLASEPFSKNKEKFNFYYAGSGAECEIFQNIAVYCYSRSLVKSSSVCPNDYVVVLADRPRKIRSSAYMDVMSLNVNHNKNVILHEFGHVFANLADEYVPSKIPLGAKNCFSKCEEYKGFEGCYQGCSKGDYYRSSENSIMRTLKTDDYGELNSQLMNENLERYE